jgi:mRNA interferase MazF
MARFVKGDVVVVPFPFSDLTDAQRRPALVVAELQGDDLILCQITSQAARDQYAVALRDEDFESGGLRQVSNVRPNRVFTADSRLILYAAGHIKQAKLDEVIEEIIAILRR